MRMNTLEPEGMITKAPTNATGDAEMTANLPATEPAARSAAAERMRRHRQRRPRRPSLLHDRVTRNGNRRTHQKGIFAAENRHDYDSVQSGLYAFLDRALGELGDA